MTISAAIAKDTAYLPMLIGKITAPDHIANPDDSFDYFEQKLAAGKSLYAFLDEQIQLNFNTPRERIIAARLCEFLDAAGYFRGNCAKIAKRLGINESEVDGILAKLKRSNHPAFLPHPWLNA